MRSIVGTDSNFLPEKRQPELRFRIPEDLPPSISRHVIPMTEPEDVFKEFHGRRERNYHLLIRRFISQILYGCTNPACSTPTCLSYQNRTTKTPLRKLTALSARTLACYLASESNPEAALCPNCPLVFPDHDHVPTVKRRPRRKSQNVTFESSGLRSNGSVTGEATRNRHLLRLDTTRSRPGVLVKSARDTSELDSSRTCVHDQHVEERWEKVDIGTQSEDKPARDSKSFTQSLFETLPLRMLEWLPFQPNRNHDTSSQDSPRPCAAGNGVLTDNTLSNSTRALSKHLDEGLPSLTPRRNLTSTESETSTKDFDVDLEGLPNGGSRHHSKSTSMLPPRQRTKLKSLMTEKTASAPSIETLPAPLSFVDETTSSPQPTLSRYVSAEELRQVASGADVTPGKKINGESDDGHGTEPPQDLDHQTDVDDQLANESPYPSEKDCIVPTYALDQIPWQTFSDLSLMQAKIEKQCLGYQRTDRRPWPDGTKPYEHLASRFSDWTGFVQQCCFYLLKDSSRLARAFEWDPVPVEAINPTSWPISILPASGLKIFGTLYRLRPSEEVLHFLSYSLDQVFLNTFEMIRPIRRKTDRGQTKRHCLSGEQSLDRNAHTLSNNQAAFVCAVMLYALAGLTTFEHQCFSPDHADLCWRTFCSLRSTGRILPANFTAGLDDAYRSDCHSAGLKCLTDVFDNEIALELVSKLAKVISNRVTFSEISKARRKQESPKNRQSILQPLMQYLKDFITRDVWPSQRSRPLPLPSTTLEWLRTIILRDWDGQPVVPRAGAVGGALQMIAAMYEDRSNLNLEANTFHTPFFAERLDSMEMPVEWLSYRSDNKTFHLLSHSFLFPPSSLVTYFRALNFATMSKAFETAFITSKLVQQFAYSGDIKVANDVELLTTMRPAMATYLVLNVRRDNVLTDAMNQLWRRQKRELMRPLKVRMGIEEGEEGVDHGGVQQEFFRCLFAEALDPAYGMFTIDERTRMTWFLPRSLEPLYKFEMLGILFSVAIYNSITLPVTFPIVFYRKLLDEHVRKLSHIQDGWPGLAKGLQELLDWSNGDVGDVFMRTYEFSFDAFGQHIDVDMQRVSRNEPWPAVGHQNSEDQLPSPLKPKRKSGPECAHENALSPQPDEGRTLHSHEFPNPSTSGRTASEAALVTNANRKQYVEDYIFWLTTKSIQLQYQAFARGFYTCLDRTALSIFNPEALRSVVEGSQHICIKELEAIAKYEDGFTPETPTIRHFWEVVRGFDAGKKRDLLEFVTASERVPVNGLASIVFIVQRSGNNEDRLPTSMTCFGRLLLPEYSTKEILKEKLCKAIENARGFGVA